MKEKIKNIFYNILAFILLVCIMVTPALIIAEKAQEDREEAKRSAYNFIEIYYGDDYEEYYIDDYVIDGCGIHVKVDGEWYFITGGTIVLSYVG